MVASNPHIKMSGNRHFTRVDLVEFKILIGKKLGAQRGEKYFNLLNRFFTQKLSKPEFNKLCIALIGRDNLSLHNYFLRSIAKNASLSTTPPKKINKQNCPLNGKVGNGYQRTCLQSLCREMFPQSPRKGRTQSFHDRRFRDRPRPHGLRGKSHNTHFREPSPKVLEQQSATELHPLGSRPVQINSVEDGEEVDQGGRSPEILSRGSIMAPVGIQIHKKGTHKALSAPLSTTPTKTCYGEGELPSISCLRERLEQKLEAEGLRVSLDCVNLLNSGLELYLKRLIRPCLEMSGSRAGNKVAPISIIDFQTAMELNPTLLGPDWLLQLEKVVLQQPEQGK